VCRTSARLSATTARGTVGLRVGVWDVFLVDDVMQAALSKCFDSGG